MSMQPLPPKKDVALALLERSDVFVHLDPRVDGVVVPHWLKKQPRLSLRIGLNMPVPIPDLRFDDEGMSCTLSFNRSPFFCVVPWKSVYAMEGEDGRGMIWSDDIPPELTNPALAPEPARPPERPRIVEAPREVREVRDVRDAREAREARSETSAAKAKKSRKKQPSPQLALSPDPSESSASEGRRRQPTLVQKNPPRSVPAPPKAAPSAPSGPSAPAPAPSSPGSGSSSGSSPTPSEPAPQNSQRKPKRELPPYLRIVK